VADDADSAETATERSPGVAAAAGGWLEALAERFRTGAALALAETRLALSTFMLMLFLTVLAAGALLFAWGFLVLALSDLAVAMGVAPLTASLSLVGVHALLAWGLWLAVNRLGRNMAFTETRRLLRGADDGAVSDDGA